MRIAYYGGMAMLWICCMGALAAIGCLFLLWTVVGWLVNRQTEGSVVCFCRTPGERAYLLRIIWLRELGLLGGRILVPEAEPEERLCRNFTQFGIELCSPAELAARLGIGAEDIGKSGIGDPAGHCGGGDLSEL